MTPSSTGTLRASSCSSGPIRSSRWATGARSWLNAANGRLVLGERGEHSSAIDWSRVREADPDWLIVAPCGFDLERARREIPTLEALPGWFDLRAVRDGKVVLADGNKYFNRSGTTIVETVEILAEILHGYPAGHHGKAWEKYGRPGVDPIARQQHAQACASNRPTYIDPATGYTVFTAYYLRQRGSAAATDAATAHGEEQNRGHPRSRHGAEPSSTAPASSSFSPGGALIGLRPVRALALAGGLSGLFGEGVLHGPLGLYRRPLRRRIADGRLRVGGLRGLSRLVLQMTPPGATPDHTVQGPCALSRRVGGTHRCEASATGGFHPPYNRQTGPTEQALSGASPTWRTRTRMSPPARSPRTPRR